MNIIKGREFQDEEVILDHNHFKACSFEECTLIYHGHGHAQFTDCSMGSVEGIKFVFREQASNTLQFLEDLMDSGFQGVPLNVAQRLVGGATFRLVEIDGERRVVMDYGPVPEEVDEEVLEALEDLTESAITVWTAEEKSESPE